MRRSTLIRRSLVFYGRTNLAVGLGVVVGTAVLTGALIVGDSMRGSLLRLTLERLGDVDHALVAGRFVRASLADDLAESSISTCATILIEGAIERHDAAGAVIRRSGDVNVIGVDARFLALMPGAGTSVPRAGSVWLNRRLADEIGAKSGDQPVAARIITRSPRRDGGEPGCDGVGDAVARERRAFRPETESSAAQERIRTARNLAASVGAGRPGECRAHRRPE
jgi:hypothetical protein